MSETIQQEAYATRFEKLADLEQHIGKELGISSWIEITQEKIDTFAKVTQDEQWIHVDPEMSAKHSPYKTTIAHGFMVLAFASKFAYDTFGFDDVTMGLNYGLNKVRFINATTCGSFLRGRISLLSFETIEGGAKYIMKVVFELKGQEKPACVAEFVAVAYTG